MNTYHNLVETVDGNVKSSGFRVSRDVALADSRTADLVASRTTFSWKSLGIVSQHVFLRHSATAIVADFHTLAECGFVHASRVNRVPMLRGLLFCYLIVPCITVDSATSELIRYVSGRPRQNWAWREYPVLHDLSTGRTYCFEESEAWGTFFDLGLSPMAQPSVAV